MAEAALKRIEIAERWFHPDEVTPFLENSLVMIDRARLVASQNKDTHEKLLKLLADADIGADAETGNFGRLFGNTGNALQRKRATTLVIKEKSERVVHLRVLDDIGVIVYIEAPALHGIRLQLTDEAGLVYCSDASEHGDLICRFRPSDAGVVAASITNPGPTEVSVLMITNHPLADGVGGPLTSGPLLNDLSVIGR
ncbi:MAG: hypothetical protein RIC89_02155 [Pseudomonadales bacterium]